MLAQLFRGVGLTQRDVAIIADLTPYDATLLEAVVNANVEACAQTPRMSCVSALWCGQEAEKKTVHDFLARTVRNHVYSFIKEGRLVADAGWAAGSAGSLGSGAEEMAPVTSAPTYQESDFKHTRPMPDGVLRLLQSVHDEWEERPHFAARFKEVARAHNETYNPLAAQRFQSVKVGSLRFLSHSLLTVAVLCGCFPGAARPSSPRSAPPTRWRAMRAMRAMRSPWLLLAQSRRQRRS